MVEMIMDNVGKVDLKEAFKRHKYILIVKPEENNTADLEEPVDRISEISQQFTNIEIT